MWRRMALANWGRPSDPQIYARMEVDMNEALQYAERESKRAGVRITGIIEPPSSDMSRAQQP